MTTPATDETWTVSTPTPAPQQTPPAAPEPAERTFRNCQLCGRRGPFVDAVERERIALGQAPRVPDSIAAAMVRWHDPLPGKEFSEAIRCQDHDACWALVLEFGEDWPVSDGRLRRRLPERVYVAPLPEPEPDPEPEPAEQVAAPGPAPAAGEPAPEPAALDFGPPAEPLDFGDPA